VGSQPAVAPMDWTQKGEESERGRGGRTLAGDVQDGGEDDDDAVVEDAAAAGAVQGLTEPRVWQPAADAVGLELGLEGSLALSSAVRRRKHRALNKRPLSTTKGMTAAGWILVYSRSVTGTWEIVPRVRFLGFSMKSRPCPPRQGRFFRKQWTTAKTGGRSVALGALYTFRAIKKVNYAQGRRAWSRAMVGFGGAVGRTKEVSNKHSPSSACQCTYFSVTRSPSPPL
jgi:hypothetical protein